MFTSPLVETAPIRVLYRRLAYSRSRDVEILDLTLKCEDVLPIKLKLTVLFTENGLYSNSSI